MGFMRPHVSEPIHRCKLSRARSPIDTDKLYCSSGTGGMGMVDSRSDLNVILIHEPSLIQAQRGRWGADCQRHRKEGRLQTNTLI
jgi:hypothetical protein